MYFNCCFLLLKYELWFFYKLVAYAVLDCRADYNSNKPGNH